MFETLFFGIPILSILAFGINLVRYLIARHDNRRSPGDHDESEMKTLRLWLIITGIAAGILGGILLGFLALMFMAVAFM